MRINWNDIWTITDPVLKNRVADLLWRNPLALAECPARIGVILISNMHCDHLDLQTLRDIGSDTSLFVPQGVRDKKMGSDTS